MRRRTGRPPLPKVTLSIAAVAVLMLAAGPLALSAPGSAGDPGDLGDLGGHGVSSEAGASASAAAASGDTLHLTAKANQQPYRGLCPVPVFPPDTGDAAYRLADAAPSGGPSKAYAANGGPGACYTAFELVPTEDLALTGQATVDVVLGCDAVAVFTGGPGDTGVPRSPGLARILVDEKEVVDPVGLSLPPVCVPGDRIETSGALDVDGISVSTDQVLHLVLQFWRSSAEDPVSGSDDLFVVVGPDGSTVTADGLAG